MARPSRRDLLASGLACAAPSAAAAPSGVDAWSPDLRRLADPADADASRLWLGRPFWANRLQDWRLERGRILCVQTAAGGVRSVGLLTLDRVEGRPGRIRVGVGKSERPGQGGFAGVLLGAGGGELDPRAAALVQGSSGMGGGLMVVVEADGALRFRDHASEAKPTAFDILASRTIQASPGPLRPDVAYLLDVDVVPAGADADDIRAILRDGGGRVLAEEHLPRTPRERTRGGVLLVAASPDGPGATWWFEAPAVGGGGFLVRPERAVGPTLSTLYSLSNGVLKLSAQCLPLALEGQARAVLDVRPSGGRWRRAAEAEIGLGWSAQFRVEKWDGRRRHEFRVRVAHGGKSHVYSGEIPAEPDATSAPLRIALFSCTAATFRPLDAGAEAAELPGARFIGRFSRANFVFPNAEITKSAAAHDPDLLVVCGDQFYEAFPTRGVAEKQDYALDELRLDALYKWFLWAWSYRELTARRPTIVLVDDHDYFQPNIWGNGGRAAPGRDHNRGGFTRPADYVRMIERIETGHNPDPYDPTPIDQGLPVYFGEFSYGGVSFAVVEDRKFKTAMQQGEDFDVYEGELLGARQEAFLARWREMRPGQPKVLITQGLWACVQTSPSGRPVMDYDSGGFPALGRRRAVSLVRDARALMIAGDQHMASLVRHGVDAYDDGPLQFTGPAGGTGWQRWFEPAERLANPRPGVPGTGDFIDGFGNKCRVLAAANPRVPFAAYRTHRKGRTQRIMDRDLKREGYGVVRVDARARRMILECWPWDADPARDAQHPGWPFEVSFDDL